MSNAVLSAYIEGAIRAIVFGIPFYFIIRLFSPKKTSVLATKKPAAVGMWRGFFRLWLMVSAVWAAGVAAIFVATYPTPWADPIWGGFAVDAAAPPLAVLGFMRAVRWVAAGFQRTPHRTGDPPISTS